MPPPYDHLARAGLRMAGYRSRYLETGAGMVHALTARGGGSLPPTVLLHGLASTGVHYAPLLRRLRPRVRRLVAPDFPAHGFSDRPAGPIDPRALLDGLGDALDGLIDPADPAVLWGNSLGGYAAVCYAARRPERVRGLVLVSPAGAPLEPDELEAFRASFDVQTYAAALRFLDRVFARPPALRHLMAVELRRRLARPELRSLVGAVGPEHAVRAELLTELQMPVLMIWGAGDRLLPQSHRAWYRQHLPPHAWIEEPAQVGHSPYLERPDTVAASTLRFLASVGAGTPS